MPSFWYDEFMHKSVACLITWPHQSCIFHHASYYHFVFVCFLREVNYTSSLCRFQCRCRCSDERWNNWPWWCLLWLRITFFILWAVPVVWWLTPCRNINWFWQLRFFKEFWLQCMSMKYQFFVPKTPCTIPPSSEKIARKYIYRKIY